MQGVRWRPSFPGPSPWPIPKEGEGVVGVVVRGDVGGVGGRYEDSMCSMKRRDSCSNGNVCVYANIKVSSVGGMRLERKQRKSLTHTHTHTHRVLIVLQTVLFYNPLPPDALQLCASPTYVCCVASELKSDIFTLKEMKKGMKKDRKMSHMLVQCISSYHNTHKYTH